MRFQAIDFNESLTRRSTQHDKIHEDRNTNAMIVKALTGEPTNRTKVVFETPFFDKFKIL
jgi:hypothetical protein